jgi:hypothetical protein
VSYPLRVPRLDRIPVRWPEILPTGPEVINGLTMLADNLSLSGLQEVIASYPAGAKLAQMPRFAGLELFKPIDYGDAEWMDLLGAQGQDLAHGDYTRYTGDWMLSHEPRPAPTDRAVRIEKFLFGFTNLTHDWGEAHPAVGDVLFGEPKRRRTLERSTRRYLATEMLTEACDIQFIESEHPSVWKAVNYAVDWSDKVAFHPPDLASNMSKNVEPIEYYTHLYRANKYLGHFAVALRMGRLLDMQHPELADPSNKLTKGVELLNALVSCNDLGVMIDYANYFLGTQLFLDGHQDEINRALVRADGLFPDGTIPRDNQERPTTLPQLVTSWQQYQVVVPGARQATN